MTKLKGLPEKSAQKGGTPYFGHFLAISGIFRSKRCARQASQGMQASRENGTPPLGGHLKGSPEGQFCTPCVSKAQIDRRGMQQDVGGMAQQPCVYNLRGIRQDADEVAQHPCMCSLRGMPAGCWRGGPTTLRVQPKGYAGRMLAGWPNNPACTT